MKYAKDRYIEILPEIDVPGHSLAAIASYPELSCTPGTYAVNSGERFMVWPGGAKHFYGLLDNTLCPANEKVYDFLDKVFTEVAQLFPFEYIHMGGDETARNFWGKTEAIKALMKKEKLKDLDEVQSYFVNRVNTKSDASRTYVLPGKQGTVVLFDIYKKDKRLMAHVEKLN